MRDMKGGINRLSMMEKLFKNVEKVVRIVNLTHLLVQNWTSRHVLDLYNSVKHFFVFPSLKKVGVSRNIFGRIITIFCVLGRLI